MVIPTAVLAADVTFQVADIMTGVMQQLNQATMQADQAVLDVALGYLTDPNLKAFPVPRFALTNVGLNLIISVAPQTNTDAEKVALLLSVSATDAPAK